MEASIRHNDQVDTPHAAGPLIPFALADGRQLVIRPIHPDDWTRLMALHLRLSAETQRMRFFVRMRRLDAKFARRLSNVDFDRRAAFVACDPARGEIHAVARYEWTAPGQAELALVVEDPYQGYGLGTFMLERLAAHARDHGIIELTAQVLLENARMIALLRDSGYPHDTSVDGTVETFRLAIAPRSAPADAPRPGPLRPPLSAQG